MHRCCDDDMFMYIDNLNIPPPCSENDGHKVNFIDSCNYYLVHASNNISYTDHHHESTIYNKPIEREYDTICSKINMRTNGIDTGIIGRKSHFLDNRPLGPPNLSCI